MYCSKCGTNITEGAAFCEQCGAPLQNASPSPQTADDETEKDAGGGSLAAPQQTANQTGGFHRAPYGQAAGQSPNPYAPFQQMPYGAERQAPRGYHVPIRNYDPSKDYTPISMWGYFGYQILFALPLVGLIMILIFSFGGTNNINVRNYARSFFCIFILLAGVVLLIVLFTALVSLAALSY